MPKKKRLLWQLYPSYLLIMLISLVAVTWYATHSLRHFYLDQAASGLEARAHLLEKQILDYLDPLDQKGIDRLCKRIGQSAATRITIILPSGKVVGDSEKDPAAMDTHVDRPEFIQALNDSLGRATRYSRTLDKNLMYVGLAVKKGTRTVAVLRTSTPVDSIDQAIYKIQIKIALVGLIIAVIAAILSLLVSRRITRPMEQIKSWAESVAGGKPHSRPPAAESEEISALSEALNRMAEELQDRIDTIMRQRNEIKAMLASMVEGVIAVDTQERLISMNDSAARMFACRPSDAQGRSIQEVVRNTTLHQFVRDALSSDRPVETDIVLSGTADRFISCHGTSLTDADGHQIGALIVLNDVSHIRKLETIRREFVANVSHEIRTPITAIRGFVETLQDGALDNAEDARRFLGIIEKHVNRLEAIIEDLLSLSRIEQEAETHDIHLSEASLLDVLQNAIQVCQVAAALKKARIDLSCSEHLVAGMDAQLLEQAVVNLLDNAIKYSDEGSSIQLSCTEGENEIVITVKDPGCGIEKRHLPRIFERFYRVDKARSRHLGGTGLGLAIVKHITQAHGGHIKVESAPGKGSAFSIHLPDPHAAP
jgi:two-component system phosphate regulon sensor histidine kinase PhoR